MYLLVLCTGFDEVGTRKCVPIREVSSFQRVLYTSWDLKMCPLIREVFSFQRVLRTCIYVHVHVYPSSLYLRPSIATGCGGKATRGGGEAR